MEPSNPSVGSETPFQGNVQRRERVASLQKAAPKLGLGGDVWRNHSRQRDQHSPWQRGGTPCAGGG